MKGDRFLTAILIVIALLVLASVGVFFLRQKDAVYLPEDTPEGVVHNYILAISQENYERAYSYLSDKENKPDFETFESNFLFYQNNAGYKIGKTLISGDSAHVELTIMENPDGFFFDRYDYVEKAHLLKENGDWKIIEMPYMYWSWGWYEEE